MSCYWFVFRVSCWNRSSFWQSYYCKNSQPTDLNSPLISEELSRRSSLDFGVACRPLQRENTSEGLTQTQLRHEWGQNPWASCAVHLSNKRRTNHLLNEMKVAHSANAMDPNTPWYLHLQCMVLETSGVKQHWISWPGISKFCVVPENSLERSETWLM